MNLENQTTVKVTPKPAGNGGSRRDLAFGPVNFILLAVSMLVVIVGLVLMSGGASTQQAYNPDIFSPMRIKVAPVVCFVGFVAIIYAIVRRPKDGETKGEAA